MKLNTKFFVILSLILIALLHFFVTVPVYADGEGNGGSSVVEGGCNDESLLGNPDDPESVAWIVREILRIIQIIGPIVVVVLSSLELVPVIITGDEQAMMKVQKKLFTRVILALSLFLLPGLVSWLLDLFDITSSGVCGIN